MVKMRTGMRYLTASLLYGIIFYGSIWQQIKEVIDGKKLFRNFNI